MVLIAPDITTGKAADLRDSLKAADLRDSLETGCAFGRLCSLKSLCRALA